MNHRLLLIASGFLGMFAVYSMVMWIGAVQEVHAPSPTGIVILTMICTIGTLVVLRRGLAMRKAKHVEFEAEIERQFREHGVLDAATFATATNVTLDSARDVLDRIARERNWKREELSGYNAHYEPPIR
jgi:hypothetical protein